MTDDEIVASCRQIEAETFRRAERLWAAMRPDERRRPWPRCHNRECNKTGVCRSRPGEVFDFMSQCEGFDF